MSTCWLTYLVFNSSELLKALFFQLNILLQWSDVDLRISTGILQTPWGIWGSYVIETTITTTLIQEKLIPHCIEFWESFNNLFVALKSAKIESKLDAAVTQTSIDQLRSLLNVDRWLEWISLGQAQKL